MKEFAKKWLLPPGVASSLVYNLARIKRRIGQSGDTRHLLERTRELVDKHKGERCFILGAGSSIAKQDLRKLKGELVISVSNTFVHPDYLIFSPRYHVTPHMLFGHSQFYDEKRFAEWLTKMDSGTGNAELFFHIGDRKLIESAGLFIGRTIHWVEYGPWIDTEKRPVDLAHVPHIWSVSELAITIAVYMGFEKIYLLGMDHDWFVGPQIYFYDQAKEHALKPHLIDLNVDAEFQMRRHAEIFKKYKYLYSVRQNIFNANADPQHYLDVFPKVDFNSLFQGGSEN